MNPKETLEFFETLQDGMVSDLGEWVKMESPTSNKESVDRLSQAFGAALEDIGMHLEWKEDAVRGNHLVARWGSHFGHLLLIGHFDTVWELGTLAQMPWQTNGETAGGPGVFDMKAGLVIGLYALRLIRERRQDRYPVSFLITSDEEEGSETSRQLIERDARSARAAFILEPAGPNNGLKTKRRGVGRYTLTAHGKAAHAGVEPEKGINAIEELSHQIIEAHSWNAQRKGISVNAGIIHGGTRTNVIPAQAEVKIDVRCDTREDVSWLQARFTGLSARNPQAILTIEGGIERPPLERSEKVLSLYRQASEIASEMEYPLSEFWTGGGSDGNLTAALGVPTLDGLGAEGGGAHAANEHILVSSLPRRASLLYHLILKQFA